MLLDLAYQRLIQGDAALSLTPTECRLIQTLARFQGVARSDRLVTILWPADESVDSIALLKVHVCKLRRKLRLSGWPSLIGTAWGRGFYLCGPVEVRDGEPPLVIPNELRPSLRRLLMSHPDEVAADQILLAVGG